MSSLPATLPATVAGMDSRSLYIDLLMRMVSNVVYQDIPTSTWSGGKYTDEAREVGRDWPSQAHTMIGLQRLANVRELCEQALRDNIPGDFIETGVWRGGACIFMRGILAAYGDTSRKVIVADSFEGLPKPKPEDFPKDKDSTFYELEEFRISKEAVQENFARYGLLDDQVEFLKGWFSETLPTLKTRQFSVIRLDGDMYESTIVALESLYDAVSPGGFVIIDDYGAIKECREAVEDFRSARGITEPLNDVDWTAKWWRKPTA